MPFIVPIHSIASIPSVILGASGNAASAVKPSGASPFANVLAEAIQKVESFQTTANDSVGRFLSGEGEELHQVALKTQQADLSFQLFMQVRNKITAAYQQVMQMQI